MALDRQLRTLVKDRVDRSLVGKPGQTARARMYATVVITLIAVAWWGLSGGAMTGRGRAALYSPGHVSAAHARFENDCNACHAGQPGTSGFRRQVTDTACLACHDGSMHHPNQKIAQTPAEVSRANHVLAISDPTRVGTMAARSADCVSCHVEHRGADLLSGVADEHCNVCHANLASATASGKTVMPDHVTSFTTSTHPTFGRRLSAADPVDGTTRLVDPTVLKFNHLKHLTEVTALGKGDRACLSCHELSPFQPIATGATPRPPFGSASDSVSTSEASLYTQPVSYTRHCAGCHQLAVPDSLAQIDGENVTPTLTSVVAPHESVDSVQAFLAARLARTIDQPAEAFAVEGSEEKTPIRQSWLAANWKMYRENIPNVETDEPEDLLTAVTASAVADAMTEAVVRGPAGCIKCHDLTESPMAALGTPITVATVPTKRGPSPQRWFTGSRFDHRAHRDMSCVSCHSGFSDTALTRAATDDNLRRAASETSFLHLPGMSWTDPTGKVQSCVDCHHADTFSKRGAGSSCLTCHNFHDRKLERLPGVATPESAPTGTAQAPASEPTPP